MTGRHVTEACRLSVFQVSASNEISLSAYLITHLEKVQPGGTWHFVVWDPSVIK